MMERKLFVTKDGRNVITEGPIKFRLGKGEVEIVKEIDLGTLDEKEFRKMFDNPKKYKYDVEGKKVVLRKK